jgi:hypothetical protein
MYLSVLQILVDDLRSMHYSRGPNVYIGKLCYVLPQHMALFRLQEQCKIKGKVVWTLCKREECLNLCREIEPRILGHPVHRVVAIPTEYY